MTSSPQPDPLLGSDLGDFIVEELVAAGGMGTVYRGRQKPPIEQPVAIKFLHSHFAQEAEIVGRFRNEAYISGMLSCPNIVRVLTYGEFAGRPYLVMEFVDGRDLKSVLKDFGTPPVAIAIFLLRDVCLALQDAHRHNVIHRDLKPSNVLVSRYGDVKLADFGIARAAEGSSLSQSGGLLGSVPYMSPEQTLRVRLEGQYPSGSRVKSAGTVIAVPAPLARAD